MGIIHILSTHEAHKIAAGQVVERPSNVVKELLENAVDAHATRITIHIEDGGRKYIRITDNGDGMDADDARSCIEKHATSKMKSVDELPSLTTFGFRGEALASIAAVSKLTIKTKRHNDTCGTQVHVTELQPTIESIGCSDGTEMIVEDLFYNVPARAKFLKKNETEVRHIIHTIHALVLTYPHLHVQLFIDGKQHSNYPPQDTMLGRAYQVWDTVTVRHMFSIEATRSDKGISITGAISNHQWFRYDRNNIYLLVNNRWVTNVGLGRALLKGYNKVLPQGRYPIAALSIMINPALIDINTHPRKEEVIFAHPRTVEQLIQETVCTALEKQMSKQLTSHHQHPVITNEFNVSPRPTQFHAAAVISDAEFHTNKTSPVRDNQSLLESSSAQLNTFQPSPFIEHITPVTPQQATPLSILETKHDFQIIGQLHKTYILLEQQDGLYCIDQHAAHERILYEQFGQRFQDIPTINLMFPQLITCTTEQLSLLEPHLFLFEQHGIRIERFSKDQLIIQSTPVHLKNIPLQEIIYQSISWIQELQSLDTEEYTKSLHEKLRAQMACKAAVKAGDVLSHEHMLQLINDLHKTPRRFSCPHGRPTGWLISQEELEKKFRRRL